METVLWGKRKCRTSVLGFQFENVCRSGSNVEERNMQFRSTKGALSQFEFQFVVFLFSHGTF
jgi:hypothetical protein